MGPRPKLGHVGHRGRGQGQAPPHPVLGRDHAPHPHADGRDLAPLPARAAAGACPATSPGPWSAWPSGRRSASRPRSSSCTGSRRPTCPSPSTTSGPDLCLEDPPVDVVLARMAARVDDDDRDRPDAARPAGRLGHRQRVQERGALGLPGQPLRQGPGPGPRHPAPARLDRGQAAAGQRRLGRRALDAARRRAWRSTAAGASPAGAAARRSSSACRARSPGSPTGARPCQPEPVAVMRVAIIGAGFGGLERGPTAEGRRRRRHADRPQQLPHLPAAALPGGHLRA